MRDRYPELAERGVKVAAIGMGWPAMAAHFKEEQKIPFTLLVDHDRETYNALHFKRSSLWNLYGPPVWIEGVKSIARFGNKIPKQDPLQLGGTIVVDKGGEILYSFRASKSADIAPLDDVIAALP